MSDSKLYWLGNSAKCKIINDILRQTASNLDWRYQIFDYGCAAGGDWPAILSDHSNLELIGYDPSRERIELARVRLKGLRAQFFTGDELGELSFKAHFVVSFSVLEHVYDRRSYLCTVKRHLAEGGTFYLNYDDGHFRIQLHPSELRSWAAECRRLLSNLLADPLARAGRVSSYKKRVGRIAIDRLITETGFQVKEVFYSNLECFKALEKTIPPDKRGEFMRLWLSVEDALNATFLRENKYETLGDTANLWQFMGSRTLVLSHQ